VSLLLDTHALIWWLSGGPLAAPALERISSAEKVFVSAASIWEAGIKAALGKLTLDVDLAHEAVREGFEPLAIQLEHARDAAALPPHHRDPFDRMLIAQARAEGLTLVTRDLSLAAYDVVLLSC
jgi:PIN domain nuclease of toxin-antitoxin system